MYGHLILDPEGAGRYTLLEEERVLGMALLRAAVPAPPALKEKQLVQRLYRAAVRLREQGVGRVLVDQEFPHVLWPVLKDAGLRRVEPESLCQEYVQALVLALLARRGVPPSRAAVCLSGSSALGPVQAAALALAPLVGRLIIDCPCRGGELARWLRREYGLPLTEPGSMLTDVTAAFTSERLRFPADLRLCGPAPELAGLRLEPEKGTLPEGFVPLPLLAALWECGRLPPLRVADSLAER